MRAPRILVILPAILLLACSGNSMRDLQDYVLKVKQREPGPVEPLPEIKQVDTFVYEPNERRDPFVMDIESEEAETPQIGGGIAPDPRRRKEELEQFPLDSLTMVGTLEQNETTWGLIKTKDGILHRVRVSNYLGKNNGQITRIDEDGIQLTEIVSDGTGYWRERQASVALSQ